MSDSQPQCSIDNMEYHLMNSGGSGSFGKQPVKQVYATNFQNKLSSPNVFQFPAGPYHDYINTSPTGSTAPASVSTTSTKRSPLGSHTSAENTPFEGQFATLPSSQSLAAVNSAILKQNQHPHQQLQQLQQLKQQHQQHAQNSSLMPMLMDPPLGRRKRPTSDQFVHPSSSVANPGTTAATHYPQSSFSSFINVSTASMSNGFLNSGLVVQQSTDDYHNVYDRQQQHQRQLSPLNPDETTV